MIGFADGEPVACLYLLHEDPAFWPQARAGEALYVHRLAVTRAASGKGWSRALLDWATGDARRRGRSFVRLDTELRPKLLALYQNAGFARVDRTPIVVGGHEVVRFERAV